MKSIRELLLEMVAVQSDTGTKLECKMAEKIFELIKENHYFQDNPQLCGCYNDGDYLERPVVWALKKGKSTKTLILMGHYDAVSLDGYGSLMPYALHPDILKEKMKDLYSDVPEWKDDLNNPDWMFGRGVADMKSGLAIALYTVLKDVSRDISLLFVAVPDEENMSSGARMATGLYESLQKKFGLNYDLCIMGESVSLAVESNKTQNIIMGSMGKVLFSAVVKGGISHASRVMNGFNPALVLANIIKRMEINENMLCHNNGYRTQPPTTLVFRDLKETYDVSTPEYCVALFNVMTLNSMSVEEMLNIFIDDCRASVREATEKYNETFDHMMSAGIVDNTARIKIEPMVITFAELKYELVAQKGEKLAAEIENAAKKLAQEKMACGMSTPDASVAFVHEIMTKMILPTPTVVVGIAPPYYPSCHISNTNADIKKYFEGIDGGYNIVEYTPGMTDLSYTSCLNSESENKIMASLTLPKSLYDIDFKALERLKLPAIIMGAPSKFIHQVGERIYMPDVENRMPKSIEKIIENMSKKDV